MFDLTGKVALITGAAGGLGDKIARTLHAQGATLALTDMRAEPMEKLKSELGSRVEVFTANLTDAEAVKTLVADVENKMGKIDILVNLFIRICPGVIIPITTGDATIKFNRPRLTFILIDVDNGAIRL